jgi:hypothetical protein
MTDMTMPTPGDPVTMPDVSPEPPLEVPSPDVPHPDPVPDQPGEPLPGGDPDRKVGF